MSAEVPSRVNSEVVGKAAEEHIRHEQMHQEEHAAAGTDLIEEAAHHARTIMIALDDTPASEKAFEWALKQFIRQNDDDLVILATVREPVLVPGAYGYMDFGSYIVQAEEKNRVSAHKLIKLFGQKLLKHFNLSGAHDDSKKLTVKGVVMRGDPREELVRKAEELKVSALIIGSRVHNRFQRVLLGSVSDYVVHHASVPVVCVRYTEGQVDSHETSAMGEK